MLLTVSMLPHITVWYIAFPLRCHRVFITHSLGFSIKNHQKWTWKHPTFHQKIPVHRRFSQKLQLRWTKKTPRRGFFVLESRKQLKRQTPLAGPVHRREKKMDEVVKADLTFDGLPRHVKTLQSKNLAVWRDARVFFFLGFEFFVAGCEDFQHI